MSIIFFSDAGNVIFKFHYWEKVTLAFLTEGNFMFVGKRNTIFTEKRENIFPRIFWERSSFIFRLLKKYHIFRKEIPYFLMIQERSNSSAICLERPSFQDIWGNYHIFMYFLRKIIFHFPSNAIFPDDRREIIFPCNFFGKIIFSEYLEKENVSFCVV